MSTTPTLRDAAQQALDALGVSESLLAQDKSYHHPKVLKAYNDLRASLNARAAGYSEEWCRAAAESEEAGNACWDAGAALTQGAGEAVEPVAEIILFGRDADLKEVAWRKGRMPKVGTKMYDAQQLQQAVAREREECAVLIENTQEWRSPGWQSTLCPITKKAIAAAIRAN